MRASGDTRLSPSCAPAPRALAFSGGGGIRTHGPREPGQQLSRLPHSTALPPLRGSVEFDELRLRRWRRGGATGRAISIASRRRSSRPATREQLAEVVRRAAARGLRVRASGSGHSFTPIALTDGVMIRCDRLDRVLAVDRAAGLVKVEAGIVLRDLNRRLDELGLAFENLGDIDRQTLAGAISTGTHGTGARLRSISAQIEAVELVLADGSSRRDLGAGRSRGPGRGADRPRGARDRLRGDDPGRARVHARRASTARGRSTRRSRASTSSTPTATTSSSTSSRTPRRRSAARRAAPTGRRSHAREPPSTPRRSLLENWVGQLFALGARRFPKQIPRLSRVAAAGTGRATKVDRSFRVFASRAADQVHGDGVRDPARARRRGGAPGAPHRGPSRAPGRVPDRGPLRRRRRRRPLRSARARRLLRRRPPGPQARLGAVLPRRRGDHGLIRRAARTGASATSRRRRRSRRATRSGTASSGCERDSTRRASSATHTSIACSDN